MTFKFYIVDAPSGVIFGTNNDTLAKDFAQSEDYFVLEPATNLWIGLNGETHTIPDFEDKD